MFDVYLSNRRDLLVVRKGFLIPLGDKPDEMAQAQEESRQRQRRNQASCCHARLLHAESQGSWEQRRVTLPSDRVLATN